MRYETVDEVGRPWSGGTITTESEWSMHATMLGCALKMQSDWADRFISPKVFWLSAPRKMRCTFRLCHIIDWCYYYLLLLYYYVILLTDNFIRNIVLHEDKAVEMFQHVKCFSPCMPSTNSSGPCKGSRGHAGKLFTLALHNRGQTVPHILALGCKQLLWVTFCPQ